MSRVVPTLPAWAKAEAGTNRVPRILSVPSLPDSASHHPVAGAEVLQGASGSLQGVKVPALREEGEVETYHLGLIQQLKAWAQSTHRPQSPRPPPLPLLPPPPINAPRARVSWGQGWVWYSQGKFNINTFTRYEPPEGESIPPVSWKNRGSVRRQWV